MKLKLLLLFITMLGMAFSAHAVDGKTVVERCNQAYIQNFDKTAKVNQQDVAWCYGYINANIDTVNAYRTMINVSPPYCFREKVDMSVILLAIVGMGPAAPSALEGNGAEMLINILRSLYSCSK